MGQTIELNISDKSIRGIWVNEFNAAMLSHRDAFRSRVGEDIRFVSPHYRHHEIIKSIQWVPMCTAVWDCVDMRTTLCAASGTDTNGYIIVRW